MGWEHHPNNYRSVTSVIKLCWTQDGVYTPVLESNFVDIPDGNKDMFVFTCSGTLLSSLNLQKLAAIVTASSSSSSNSSTGIRKKAATPQRQV
ncbi:hypothetical protein Taro_012664 [Colocasia esculenta]|uniref:Uncharacterized protein n=1 Tax=Colocasia esculenta TaxID=4460 RepID=A0A843U9U4_COLES|nr:hypothetical protein [Colocasia esculenta]